jgi:hypothetical protein
MKKAFLYKLKRSDLTVADMKFMSNMRNGGVTDAEVVDWLDRVVEGGVMHIPLDQFPDLYAEVYKQFYEIDDPEDASGKA